MASSLFGSRNQKSQNNIMNMLNSFNDFKNSIAGKNPQSIVKNLLSTGQMSNQQFEQLSSMAKQLSSFLK